MHEGELKNVCNEDVTVMRGSYDWYGPDGVRYQVDWYADEEGKSHRRASAYKVCDRKFKKILDAFDAK